MDLKKEIKKLQRLRDQIKTWVASTEVKDKDALVEARKLIETKMETFKICEKETKTKTYSKEGLAREDKMDPEEEARLRTTSWLAEYVEKFQQQVEEKDFDIEKLSAGKGKKQNKSQIEQLQKHIANHKFHITKLEGIIRLINNEVLEPDPVDALQEDFDYYLDSYQEDEYIQVYDQDFFYESLGLDELELVNVDRLSQPVAPVKKGGDDTTETSSKESKELKNGKKAAASVIPLTIGRARSKAEKKADQEREESEALALAAANAAATGTNGAISATTPSKMMVASPQAPPAPTPVVASPPILQGGTSMAAILKRESDQQQQEKERQKVAFAVVVVTRFVHLFRRKRMSLTSIIYHSNFNCNRNNFGNSSYNSKNNFVNSNSNKPHKRHYNDNNNKRLFVKNNSKHSNNNKLPRQRRLHSRKQPSPLSKKLLHSSYSNNSNGSLNKRHCYNNNNKLSLDSNKSALWMLLQRASVGLA